MKPKLLLHVCCAPCSTHCIELLKKDYDLTLFFSNPNIFPKKEYDKRLENAKKVAQIYELEMIEGKYDHKTWRNFIKGLENEPEKGKRCSNCFLFNLKNAADYANENEFDYFTTTLSISPHKDSKKIIELGKMLGNFLELDFKKNDGFKNSLSLSEEYDLYRQDYCGCEFSVKK